MAPVGDLAKDNPVLQELGLPPVGRPARGHLLLTKTLLIVGQEGSTQRELNVQPEASAEPAAFPVPNFQVRDPKLVAYDKTTGSCRNGLPRNATAAPMTFCEWHGRIAVRSAMPAAELIVLSLLMRAACVEQSSPGNLRAAFGELHIAFPGCTSIEDRDMKSQCTAPSRRVALGRSSPELSSSHSD